MKKNPANLPRPIPRDPAVKLIAVIDIGARSIRMEIAEVGADGDFRILDALSRPIALGKDSFGEGYLRRETIEHAVRILRAYRAVLQEYGLSDPASIRAVATSAIREAENRQAVLDRIFMATGFNVVCLEEAEMSRLIYLAIRDLMTRRGASMPERLLAMEVGGGTTEALLIDRNRVIFSESFRMGALRAQERIDQTEAQAVNAKSLFKQDLETTLRRMRGALPRLPVSHMMAMSADARIAAAHWDPKWDERDLARFTAARFRALAEDVAAGDVDDVVRQFRVTYADAETIGTALVTISEIARAFGVRHILVPKISLRTALEIDLAGRPSWTAHFQEQIELAARALLAKYRTDIRHAEQVARLCDLLFRELSSEHGLDPACGFLLRIAALLHEIGQFVSPRSHHKHSQYLILNSDLFGLTRDDMLLVALVARYHRRSAPSPLHPEYNALPRDRRLTVQKLAALLRVANALEQAHRQRISGLAVSREPGRMILTLEGAEDLSLERVALREKGDLFEAVFGMAVSLRTAPLLKGPESNV